jgi:hypothetical protein
VTANVTGTLVADPEAFVATIRNCSPDIAAVEALIANVGASDPLKPFPSARLVHVLPPSIDSCHWKLGVGLPPTPTEKLAGCPAITVALDDCMTIDGAWPRAEKGRNARTRNPMRVLTGSSRSIEDFTKPPGFGVPIGGKDAESQISMQEIGRTWK